VLAFPVSSEFLEPIPRRNPEIGEVLGGIEDHELAQRNPLEIGMELLHPSTEPDPLGVFVSERLQHPQSITCHVMNATRYEEDLPPGQALRAWW
jgi:hypothetical protein